MEKDKEISKAVIIGSVIITLAIIIAVGIRTSTVDVIMLKTITQVFK